MRAALATWRSALELDAQPGDHDPPGWKLADHDGQESFGDRFGQWSRTMSQLTVIRWGSSTMGMTRDR